MSSFDVKIRPIRKLEDHPNADRLDLATILGYRCVVAKGQHQEGDLVAYVPEDAILPEELLSHMGLEGKLAGKQKNRVKAVRLRGTLSQGVVIPLSLVTELLERVPEEGEDVAEALGIVKWDPPIPQQLQGVQRKRPGWFPTYTDLEHLKKFPDVLEEGELVVITEKLHGACMSAGYRKDEGFHVSSRRINLVESEDNSYWRAARLYDLESRLQDLLTMLGATSVVVYGELLGVQDLKYGFDKDVGFKAFDVMVDGEYVDYVSAAYQVVTAVIGTVPILYTGPFSTQVVDELVSGKSTIADHIREGIVIRPLSEKIDSEIGGRVVMKVISEDYLTRRGGTEHR